MLRRALDAAGKTSTKVYGVSRFSRPEAKTELERFGIAPVSCDLADPDQVAQLPEIPNVEYLAGQKFGTDSAPDETWIQNTVVPSLVARKFRRSRIVVFSTGCVYPFSPTAGDGKGATESTPVAFLGEYASTCVGRERVFTHYSRKYGTPQLMYRLNYSVELRYGVLVDVATPPKLLNVTGAEKLSIRRVAEDFGRLLGRTPQFTGQEAASAWISDASESFRLFGPTTVPLDRMMQMVADYLRAGGKLLGKPTHFETRDGKF